jgi:hypothetical protein
MASSSRANRARWAVAGFAAALALCTAALVAATSARADPWWAETTQATVTAGTGPADALDRYLATQSRPIVQTITVPATPADTGFQVDWANIAIGVGVAAVAVLAVMSAVVAARHGGHGGPGRPVTHG